MNQPYDPNQQYGQQPAAGQAWGQQPQQWGQQPQQYGAPQGAQPWGQAPQKSGNGKLIALIGGGVALLAIIGLVLWLVLSGGGRSAKDTVTAFMEAAKKGDASAAKDVSCPAIDQEIGDNADGSGLSKDASYTVDEVKENGVTATAVVTATVENESIELNFKLEKNSDGDFEVCDFSLNLPSGSGG